MSRFHAGSWLGAWTPATFPWATFVINVTGSALLGFLVRALPPPVVSPRGRAFLLIGLCGGYTTFSAFDLEVLTMLQLGRYVPAAAYATGSVVACIAGVYCGFVAAAAARGRRTGRSAAP